jgi:hypothetical protein
MQWQTPTAAAAVILLFMLSLVWYRACLLQALLIMKIYCQFKEIQRSFTPFVPLQIVIFKIYSAYKEI